MADLMYGGEIGPLIPSDGTVVEVTATGNVYDTAKCRCAVYVFSRNSSASSPTFAAKDTLWVHWDTNSETHFDNRKSGIVELVASSTPIIRVASTQAGQGNDTLYLEYFSGGTWTTVGGSQTFTTFGVRQTFDLFFEKSSGTLRLYSSGSLVTALGGTAVIALQSLGAITRVDWRGNYDGGIKVSQNVVSEDSTIGVSVYTRYPNGAGASSDYTGSYANVDEIVYSDADAITSTVSGDTELFTHTGPTLPSTIAVRGVYIAARAKTGGTVTGQKGALRIGSTTYASAANVLDAGFGADGHMYAVSPATSAAFTKAEIEAMQYGHRSLT
jgi:hypothetical protein